jgi:hypothetical protein
MRKLAVLCVIAVAFALPATALAKKIRLAGGVTGDPNSRISMRVTVNKGVPTKVGGIRGSNLDVSCDGEPLDGFRFQVLGSVPVSPKRTFRARIPNAADPKERLRISGKVRRKGRRATGTLQSRRFTIQADEGPRTCEMPKQRFSVRKR